MYSFSDLLSSQFTSCSCLSVNRPIQLILSICSLFLMILLIYMSIAVYRWKKTTTHMIMYNLSHGVQLDWIQRIRTYYQIKRQRALLKESLDYDQHLPPVIIDICVSYLPLYEVNDMDLSGMCKHQMIGYRSYRMDQDKALSASYLEQGWRTPYDRPQERSKAGAGLPEAEHERAYRLDPRYRDPNDLFMMFGRRTRMLAGIDEDNLDDDNDDTRETKRPKNDNTDTIDISIDGSGIARYSSSQLREMTSVGTTAVRRGLSGLGNSQGRSSGIGQWTDDDEDGPTNSDIIPNGIIMPRRTPMLGSMTRPGRPPVVEHKWVAHYPTAAVHIQPPSSSSSSSSVSPISPLANDSPFSSSMLRVPTTNRVHGIETANERQYDGIDMKRGSSLSGSPTFVATTSPQHVSIIVDSAPAIHDGTTTVQVTHLKSSLEIDDVSNQRDRSSSDSNQVTSLLVVASPPLPCASLPTIDPPPSESSISNTNDNHNDIKPSTLPCNDYVDGHTITASSPQLHDDINAENNPGTVVSDDGQTYTFHFESPPDA
jgi:hypothetical protein